MSGTPKGQHASVDKFLVVSKLLIDKRLEELVKENQELRLSLFWEKHSQSRLMELMKHANRSEYMGGIGCNCFHCETVGRMDIYWHQAADMQSDCYFSSYLEGLLLSYGLSVANDGYVS
jgi:hypothetical protein